MEEDYIIFSQDKEKEEWKDERKKRRWQLRDWHKYFE